MATKKQVEIALSKLVVFDNPKVNLEQYSTPSSIASDMLWNMHMQNDCGVIADFGCGSGILGFGALLLGVKKCYFIDKDEEAIEIALKNRIKLEEEFEVRFDCEFVISDVAIFNNNVDIVVMNPPFGVQREHADKVFLESVFKVANVIYSFHKTESRKFLESICKDNGFEITHVWNYTFPLKPTMEHHTQKKYEVDVICVRLKKI